MNTTLKTKRNPTEKNNATSIREVGAPLREVKEHKIQSAGVALAHTLLSPDQLLFSIPNGGIRDFVTASHLKSEGLLKGMPDLGLLVKRGAYGGLFIEVKRETGQSSKEQKYVRDCLEENGYFYTVCRSPRAIYDTVKNYLSLQK